MKNIKLIISLFIVCLLYSCNGSEIYLGKWNALDSEGNKYEITFTKDKFIIKNSLGKSNIQNYYQISVGHLGSSNNFSDTFEIKLSNGQNCQIHFPKDDQSVGLIRYEFSEKIFSISKKGYLRIEDISKE